jgi:hypothetical protein
VTRFREVVAQERYIVLSREMWWLNRDIMFSAERCGGSIKIYCSQQRNVVAQERYIVRREMWMLSREMW